MEVNPEKLFETKKDSRWVNKQRTLIVTSRGITDRHRHLMLDLMNMMPHSKKEVKIEKKDIPSQISELCYIHTCSNFIYFEARKRTDLYMWIGKFPNGPSVKFLVENIHTSHELKLTGNCLKGSRPILSFDGNFKNDTQLKLMRELFVHTFNVPRYHPKCKPTVDHLYAFAYTDKKIWFRNYQIATEDLGKDLENNDLYEVGPRFVLNPIVILEGALIGNTLYKNPEYKTRTKLSIERKRQRKEAMLAREMKQSKHEATQEKKVKSDDVDDLLNNDDDYQYENEEDEEEDSLEQEEDQEFDEEEDDEEDEE